MRNSEVFWCYRSAGLSVHFGLASCIPISGFSIIMDWSHVSLCSYAGYTVSQPWHHVSTGTRNFVPIYAEQSWAISPFNVKSYFSAWNHIFFDKVRWNNAMQLVLDPFSSRISIKLYKKWATEGNKFSFTKNIYFYNVFLLLLLNLRHHVILLGRGTLRLHFT